MSELPEQELVRALARIEELEAEIAKLTAIDWTVEDAYSMGDDDE